MYYIVFDLEFNQHFSTTPAAGDRKVSYPFEIIQIGAVKLDDNRNTIANYSRYIRPALYPEVSPFITELTGITTEQLLTEPSFPEVYRDFLSFMGRPDSILLSWGKSDIKELYRSLQFYKLDCNSLPKQYIDLQPYASVFLQQPKKKLLRLQSTVEALELPLTYPFHNAQNDAYYTAEVFKKIYNSSIQSKLYDPIYISTENKPRQPKRTIDFDALYQQFEKMYQRPMSEAEQSLIKLAYQMGKTGQFIK